MQVYFSYQQDTVKNNIRLKLQTGLQENEGLRIQRNTLTIPSVQERDTISIQETTEQQPSPPTRAQIRYWQWQREQKLVVNNSRYMEPKTKVELTTSAKVIVKGMDLPVQKNNYLNTDWLTIIIFFALALFATVKYSYSKYLNNLMQSVLNYSTSFRMFQEKNVSSFQGAFRLDLFFYITAAVFLFQVINHFNIEFPYKNAILFLYCFGATLIYFFVKKTMYRIIGSIVESTSETGEYLFNLNNFNRIAGLFLFPVIILIAYVPLQNIDILVVAGIVLLALLYILLLQRGIAILLKKQFSIFYLFLYLCTLEFLPLLLIYKIVVV